MNVLISLFSFMMAILVIVSFHEWGHYLLARFSGVFVHRFSIGFGPVVFAKKDRRGCEWAVSAVPLGGYVKLHSKGLEEEMSSGEVNPQWLALEDVSPWKQLLIFFAGPFFSFLLGFLLYFGVALYGTPTQQAEVLNVLEGTPASQVGLRKGDIVLDVDHKNLQSLTDIQSYLILKEGQEVVLSIQRGERQESMAVTLSARVLDDGSRLGYLGVMFNAQSPVHYRAVGVLEALNIAGVRSVGLIENTAQVFRKMLNAEISPKQLSGPIVIAQVSAHMLTRGILFFIEFIALLSLSIGFLNLLPIPGLDGGHMLFAVFHILIGRPVNEKLKIRFFILGYVLVLFFMLFSFYNDIARLLL